MSVVSPTRWFAYTITPLDEEYMYALCFNNVFGLSVFRTKNIHCVKRVWTLTFLERRIHIVFRLKGRRNISDRVGESTCRRNDRFPYRIHHFEFDWYAYQFLIIYMKKLLDSDWLRLSAVQR